MDETKADLGNTEQRINKIETELIGIEHRTLKIVANVLNHGLSTEDKAKQMNAWLALLGAVLRRQTLVVTIAVMSGITALIGLFLAFQSNHILEEQNRIITLQNEKIDLQSSLMEAERRGSQVVMMDNVLQELSFEIRNQKADVAEASNGYSLSAPLVGRIAATTLGFLPYRFLEDGELTDREYSLERGQMLLALLNSNLDSPSLQALYETSSFSFAYVKGIDFSDKDLSNADLTHANFAWTTLYRTKMDSANIQAAVFDNARAPGVDFSNQFAFKCSFKETGLNDANFTNGTFTEADFSGADLTQVNFSGSYFRDVDFTDVTWDPRLPSKKENSFFTNFPEIRRDSSRYYDMVARHLAKARAFYKCKGIPIELRNWLERKKPCLFEETGCDSSYN